MVNQLKIQNFLCVLTSQRTSSN